ncbi:MAG TPA: hypothetical protein VJQ09_08150, partial [Candidatus Limnocylindria bacterium]|nr:hypothetical protein [Candidatus Limnocylindria bacterium]
MSFRLRVALLASIAVAIAIVAAAGLMYVVVERQLVGQVDQTLIDTAAAAQTRQGFDRPVFAGPGPFAHFGLI